MPRVQNYIVSGKQYHYQVILRLFNQPRLGQPVMSSCYPKFLDVEHEWLLVMNVLHDIKGGVIPFLCFCDTRNNMEVTQMLECDESA